MQTKAYFASSVPAALEVARRELGPDAMLVGSRPAPPEVRQFGRLEVTFAWTPSAESPAPAARPPRTLPQAGPHTAGSGPAPPASGEMEEIRRQLRAIRSAVGAPAPEPAVDSLVNRLTDAGLDVEVSRELATSAMLQTGDPEANIFGVMVQRIAVSPFRPMRAGESRTMALIGPPGRGKSTTLIKVAVSRALANQVPVRVYTTGVHPVGASEQMARYCSILGSPHQSFESTASLELALQGESWKGLTLVDTPGLSAADHEERAELAGFFARHQDFETHMVLRADCRYADMLAVLEQYSSLQPRCLLFTGMDETTDWSSMVSTLIRTSMAITFVGTGKRIPEDLADADAGRLARAVLARLRMGAPQLAQRAAA